ncbi:MAG: response regulator [Paracoccaceae bacterium]|nr:response regulator [Maritimibacter sp.]
MDDILHRFQARRTPERPLNGLKVLVVEDSRFAAQAVRLLTLYSGARLRRADSLAAAHRHLAIYRPDIVIVDMGLPDGDGAELIGELARADPRVPVLVGTSGDPGAETSAMAAGADGFLAKPVESLAAFQQLLIGLLPAESAPRGLRALPDEVVAPDAGSLAEDLKLAAEIMREGAAPGLAYAAQFLGTVARAAHDPVLEAAAHRLAGAPNEAPQVAHLLADRLAEIRASA